MDAYPASAMNREVEGAVRLQCRIEENGSLADCKLLSETPLDYGFGQAARALTRYFVIKPMMVDGKLGIPAGRQVELPIRFAL